MDVLVSFLLDRSGSMQRVKSDVIGGFNEFLRQQREGDGKCRFVLTLFDTEGIETTDFADVSEVPDLTPDTYTPRSGTPLLDAIGETVKRVDDLNVEVDRVLFVIYTDGEENSSREYNRASVKALIEERQRDDNWDFIFLGAGIDAYAEAGALGIPQGMTFTTDSARSGQVLLAASAATSAYRLGDEDYTSALDEERV